MARKRQTVRLLAKEAGIEVDEALVALWDAGFNDVASPESFLAQRESKRARRALGLATRRELQAPVYWTRLFGITEVEFVKLLESLDIEPSLTNSRIPRQSLHRLRVEARRRGLDPTTGRQIPLEKAEVKLKPSPERPWEPPAHQRKLTWLTEEQVVGIHEALVRDFAGTSDPIDPPGIKSMQLLASAVFRPQTSLGNRLKYPTVESSASALLHSLIQDHPFHNGNKRTALVAMLAFLDKNGMFPIFGQDEVFKLVLQIAQHRIAESGAEMLADREVLAISRWMCRHTRFAEKGERVISMRRLRQILTAYGCVFDFAVSVGNRVNISRQIKERGFLGMIRSVTLRTQIYYESDGRDVEKNSISKVRADLQLDDHNGVDSHIFYQQFPDVAEEFINRYRKTLRRLGRL